jgi:hypothetical protein
MIALKNKLQMIKKNIRKAALPRINAHLRFRGFAAPPKSSIGHLRRYRNCFATYFIEVT